jgi:hypothetical protein
MPLSGAVNVPRSGLATPPREAAAQLGACRARSARGTDLCFTGYRGDLAFAVLVEGGGLGADSAGPIANAFLRKL